MERHRQDASISSERDGTQLVCASFTRGPVWHFDWPISTTCQLLAAAVATALAGSDNVTAIEDYCDRVLKTSITIA